MQAVATTQVINETGQITLGQHFAGQKVTVETLGEGIWHIHTADAIPENEQWLHEPENRQKLDSALAWAAQHPATGENTDAILARLAADC